MVFPSFGFTKSAPSSNLSAEAGTNFNIMHRDKIVPFSLIGQCLSGLHTINKWSEGWLLVPVTKR